jgi:hypothetical protein
MPLPIRLLACAVTCLLSACSTSRWYDAYRFSPAPLEAQVTSQADPDAQVRALVTVRGVSRAKEGRPDAVEVRMRLENLGRKAATLVEQSLSLVTADLDSFGRPEVQAERGLTVEPGASKLNLRGLNLRWGLSFAGREVTTGASFQRDVPVRAYSEPGMHVGFGVGYTHIH